MPNGEHESLPFAIKDCDLIAIATGKRAQNLSELRSLLSTIESDSIYYHFWGSMLRPRFDDPEYHNDFAFWTRHGLHDKVLSERMGLIDPSDFYDLEDLRRELIEVIEERLDEVEYPPSSRYDNQFEFIRSQIVIFDTNQPITDPQELMDILPITTVGSVFYHFIDARRRNDDAIDDFQNWMRGLNEKYTPLCNAINEIDPFFSTLAELRARLVHVFQEFFQGRK